MMLFAAGPLRWRRPPVQPDAPLSPRPPAPGQPALFVDLDTLLAEPLRDNVEPAALQLRPGVPAALAGLAARGFALLVVTNQSGLARGHFTRAQFARLQGALERLLREAADVRLLDFLVCPHAPGPGGEPSCLCRMPAPGLLTRAARRHDIALARSWMVGSTLDGIEAGHRAGCPTLLLARHEPSAPRKPLRQPDARCDDWAEAAQHLVLKEAPTLP
jgi:D-glycero-D-manno-heptose 1,7-bisphosphate phosphatase